MCVYLFVYVFLDAITYYIFEHLIKVILFCRNIEILVAMKVRWTVVVAIWNYVANWQ